MLSKAKTLKGYKLHGQDGEFGKVKKFYFDDQHWGIRYLIADTGTWLIDHQVLVSPCSLVGVDKKNELITLDLTKKQIENSPFLDSDKSVSRQFQLSYYGHNGLPMYWRDPRQTINGKKPRDLHLRSMRKMSGYQVQDEAGEMGHVNDFLIDEETWAICYLSIDTKHWGKRQSFSCHPPMDRAHQLEGAESVRPFSA